MPKGSTILKTNNMHYDRVLTIAGSDSGGGAGIQADIKTISACGCFATTAITAITPQNTLGVSDIHTIPTQVLINQIDAVLSDIGADAIKIGMLSTSELITAIDTCLSKYHNNNIVLDPVMVSTSGHRLIEEDAIRILKETILFNSRVITPNIPEAEILLGREISNQNELVPLAKELSFAANINKDQGDHRRVSVLLKAGHLLDDVLIDVFYNAETDECLELESRRLYTKNTHGTGCSLSSALASFLAKGNDLNSAVKNAKDFINQAIIHGAEYQIGNGHGPVKHFYKYWK